MGFYFCTFPEKSYVFVLFFFHLTEYSEQESTSCILTPSVMACVVRDVRYYEHTATLTLLKYVDLSLLTEREDKLCFYGNLVNLMTLHVTLRQMEIHMASEEVNKIFYVCQRTGSEKSQ